MAKQVVAVGSSVSLSSFERGLQAIPRAIDTALLPAVVAEAERKNAYALLPIVEAMITPAPRKAVRDWLSQLAAISDFPDGGQDRAAALKDRMVKLAITAKVVEIPAWLLADQEQADALLMAAVQELGAWFPAAARLRSFITAHTAEVNRVRSRLIAIASRPTEDEARAALPAWMHERAKADPVARLRLKWCFRFPSMGDLWESRCFEYVRRYGEAVVDAWHQQIADEQSTDLMDPFYHLRFKQEALEDTTEASKPKVERA